MKRFLADWIGNYVFFVPLVLLFNRAWGWPTEVLLSYLLTSVLLSAVGGRMYSLFLKYVVYPIFRENFQ